MIWITFLFTLKVPNAHVSKCNCSAILCPPQPNLMLSYCYAYNLYKLYFSVLCVKV